MTPIRNIAEMPPDDIIAAAEKVGQWFANQNIKEWALGPCQSRSDSPAKDWQPITKKLLDQFELEGSGECLLVSESGYKSVAKYEWLQGRNPHGFIDTDDRWYPASDFTKIMINP